MQHAGSKYDLTLCVLITSGIYLCVSCMTGCASFTMLFVKEDDNHKKVKLVAPLTLIMTIFGFINCILAIINFKRIFAETSAMSSWKQVDGCVSKPYMTLSNQESTGVDTIDHFARVSLALSILIPTASCFIFLPGAFYIRKPSE